jgi:predicted Fe-S protein YdhL (DUF1289 family)
MLLRTNNSPTIDAPCVRNCCLDMQGICMGCGRSLDEIRQWSGLTDQQRAEHLEIAALRRRQRSAKSPVGTANPARK